MLEDLKFLNCNVVNEITKFNSLSDVIVVNRYDNNVKRITKKIYSRDIFRRD